jgi:hypothetical protein
MRRVVVIGAARRERSIGMVRYLESKDVSVGGLRVRHVIQAL